MIEVDLDKVFAELGIMQARLQNHAPVIQEAATIGFHSVRERITTTKTGPDGSAWAAWMEPTAIHRQKRGTASQGLLWDSGELLKSIEFHIGSSSAEIGTKNEYAGFLQNGTSKMAARPFIGWSHEDESKVGLAFIAWVEKAINT